ncbi:RNA-directed DNA polymerase [Chitinophagaceae bacterium MMS25-I14]
MNDTISLFDVTLAYKKLKSYFYYDNYDLFSKNKIAEFEVQDNSDLSDDLSKGITESLKELTRILHLQRPLINPILKKKVDKIDVKILPKGLEQKDDIEDAGNIYRNKYPIAKYEVESVNYFIDADIDILIISVLWLMKIGYKLEQNLYKKAYGNRLCLTQKKEMQDGLRMFKPYFNQYQKWRNEGIDVVDELINKKEDAAIINLDIQSFFYNAEISQERLNTAVGELTGDLLTLHNLFLKINIKYTNVLVKYKHRNVPYQEVLDRKCFVLPIGLPSSYVLANWYMDNFDKRILEEIKPVYYSRYVDDILIVINHPDYEKKMRANPCENFDKKQPSINLNSVDRFIYEELYPILEVDREKTETSNQNSEDDNPYFFKITCEEYRLLRVQKGKTFLYLIDANESTHFLDRLKKKLLENSSEFRQLPSDEEEFPDYSEETFDAVFSGKGKKTDKILGLRNAKFVLTVFLANKIFAALKHESQYDEGESKKILSFFKGANAVEYYSLWERIIVYLIVHKDRKGFMQFYENTIITIWSLPFANNTREDVREIAKSSLLEYFKCAIELSLALNPDFYNQDIKKAIKRFWEEGHREFEAYSELGNIFQYGKYRKANMIRDKYIVHPLLNYTNLSFNTELSLIDISLPVKVNNKYAGKYLFKKDKRDLQLNPDLEKYSPRLIKLWEACYYYQYFNITDGTKRLNDNTEYVYKENDHLEYLDKATSIFFRFNYYHGLYRDIKDEDALKAKEKELRLKMFGNVNSKRFKVQDHTGNKDVFINELKILSNNKKLETCKLAVANTKCSDKNFEMSMEGTPIINGKRYRVFSNILNLSVKEKADLLGMPECSVPYDLVPLFAKFGAKSNLASVIGLEHWRVENVSYNFIVTIIPLQVSSSKDAIIIYRLKNHYSPEEARLVLGSGSDLKVPTPQYYRYDLINWRNLYFSNFYCFELANVLHRSLFVSMVDLMVVSEWNSDINYFSGIVETSAREIHCYFMQVNNSAYGDSRVTLPAHTISKNQLQIKGGENDTILIAEININKLREFQYKKYELQKDDKFFKPASPDFNRKNVKKRMNDELIFGKGNNKTLRTTLLILTKVKKRQ